MAMSSEESERIEVLHSKVNRLEEKYNDILKNIDALVKQQVEDGMLRVFDRVDIQKRLTKVFQNTEFARLQEDIAKLQQKSSSFAIFPSAPPKAASEARNHHISKTLIDKTFKELEHDWKLEPEPGNWERETVSDFIMEWWKKYAWNDPILKSIEQNNSTAYQFTRKNLPIEVNKLFYKWLSQKEDRETNNDVGKIKLTDEEGEELLHAKNEFKTVDIKVHPETEFWKNLQGMNKQDRKDALSFFEPPKTFVDRGLQQGMSDPRIREAWKREVMKKESTYPNTVYGSKMPTDNYYLTFD